MKRRKPLARRTPMKCGKPLVNQAPLKRTGPVKPRNNQRANAKRVRNFGEPGGEADIVRNMECACAARLRDDWMLGKADQDMACEGPVDAAHAVARGGGGVKGDRWRILALCRKHHEEAGEADRPGQVGETKRSRFVARYGFDPIVVADDIAVGHPRPLGIRGLADRWSFTSTCTCTEPDGWCSVCNEPHGHTCIDCDNEFCTGCWEGHAHTSECDRRGSDETPAAPLDDHETDALMGWVRREADRETERLEQPACSGCGAWPTCCGSCGVLRCDACCDHDEDAACEVYVEACAPGPADPDDVVDHIATRLGGVFDQGDRSLARALLDAAVQR